MTTTADKRAWLAGHGHPELAGKAGKLSDELHAEYDAAHEDYTAGAGPADFVGPAEDPPAAPGLGPDDYPGDPRPGLADTSGPGPAEDRPERPKAPRWRPPWHRDRQPKPAKPRPGGPRISVAPLIEATYTDLAGAAGAIPPLQRLFYAQAPIAGVVLDPVVQGTVADTVLQPLARNYERSLVVAAMAGTPAFLMGTLATAPQPVEVDGVVQWQPVIDQDGRPVLAEDGETPLLVMQYTDPTIAHLGCMMGLRYCVRAMAQLAGDALDRVQERAAENAAREDAAERFIAFLLGQPMPPAAEETARQEGAAAGLGLAGAAGSQ